MNRQDYARRLLECRETGPSISDSLWRARWRYVLTAAVCVLLSLVGAAIYDPLPAMVAGAFVGMVLRDIGWLRRTKLAWPVTEEFTDWTKVEVAARKTREPNGTQGEGP